MSSLQRHKIIVGVDFGTTYTGVSFISTAMGKIKDVNDIDIIADWPTASGKSREAWKTPSRLALASENATGRKKIIDDSYGFQVEPGLNSYSWFKLGLDRTAAATEFDDPDFKSLEESEGAGLYQYPSGWDAVDTCAAFLKHIYAKTMEVLGKRFTKEVLDITPIEFWLTVPAMWSDIAKSNTRNAATRAGFGERHGDAICLIPEPEAAAIAAISALDRGESGDIRLKPGTGLMVCDCGGGTVDLTSYRIKSMKPHPEFEELVVGVGGKCGSTYVDRKFYRWLSSMFTDAFDSLSFASKGPGSKLMTAFEDMKRTFETVGSLDQLFSSTLVFPEQIRNSLPTTRHYDPDEAEVVFSRSEMLSFFQPATDRIIGLIKQQVADAKLRASDCPIKTIVLVGGFGDSNFLFGEIEKWCQLNGDISLICPPKPQAAIVRGAALRGLQTVIPISRRCRRHYGFACSMPFRDGVDPEAEARYCEWNGEKRCNNRITWQINKGDQVDEGTLISHEMFTVHVKGQSHEIGTDLYVSDEEVPPEHISSSGVQRIGSIEASLEGIDLEQFISKRRNGKKLWHVDYDIQVLLGQEHGMLAFRAILDGEEQGITTIKYAGD